MLVYGMFKKNFPKMVLLVRFPPIACPVVRRCKKGPSRYRMMGNKALGS